MIFDKPNGMFGEQIGCIAGLLNGFFVVPPIEAPVTVDVRDIIDPAVSRAAKHVEALAIRERTAIGLRSQMPLAKNAGIVAGRLQILRDGAGLVGKARATFAQGLDHSGALLVPSGQQCGPGRRTRGCVGMEIRQP